MATQGVDFFGSDMPDADGGVAAAPGQHTALLGMERHALHRGRQIGKLVEQLPRLRVPDFDHMILGRLQTFLGEKT